MKTLTEIKNNPDNYGKAGLKFNSKTLPVLYNEINKRVGRVFKLNQLRDIIFEGLTDVDEHQMNQELSSRICSGSNKNLIKWVGPSTYELTDEFYKMIGDIESSENEIIDEYVPSSNKGYVYLLRNPAFINGLIKIGKTTKNPSVRAKELRKTGVPAPFEVIAAVPVNDCDGFEAKMHEIFADVRYCDEREFFMVDETEAVETLINESINFI